MENFHLLGDFETLRSYVVSDKLIKFFGCDLSRKKEGGCKFSLKEILAEILGNRDFFIFELSGYFMAHQLHLSCNSTKPPYVNSEIFLKI